MVRSINTVIDKATNTDISKVVKPPLDIIYLQLDMSILHDASLFVDSFKTELIKMMIVVSTTYL